VRVWFSPTAWIWAASALEVSGRISVSEEERSDIFCGPFQSVNATAVVVERGPVRASWPCEPAAGVISLARCADPAVSSVHGPAVQIVRLPGNTAALFCVGRGGHCGLGVDSLDDVDLASVGPVRSNQPPCRPSSTSLGHMVQIDDKQTGIISGLRGKADAAPSPARRFVRVIASDVNGRTGGNDASRLGLGFADVVHIPVCRIAACPEIKVVEKSVPRKSL